MEIKPIELKKLLVNRANDRHGELENETAAIAWLFSAKEAHMRNLAKDIAAKGGIYELPLVSAEGDRFVVFDGNRRVTCLKLLLDPRRAPTVELQTFFAALKERWQGDFPVSIECQVEDDRDRIDEILFRRHTGSQNGIGQSTWDDRMKANFVTRSGKGSGINVADEIEKRLEAANLLPEKRKIPRSTMNRLLSAEPFRNRLGFTISRGKFEYTHDAEFSLRAMARVADDLASRKLVLGDIWDVDGKRSYLDILETEGVLPSAANSINRQTHNIQKVNAKINIRPTAKAIPVIRTTLIPQTNFNIAWPGRLSRHHQIFEELQFHLDIKIHKNAISVLFRVLLELSIENCIQQEQIAVQDGDKLAARALKVANHLNSKGKLDQKSLGIVKKFQQLDQLVSADTLNRYVHSSNFAPSPEHLMSLWDSLSDFTVACLKA